MKHIFKAGVFIFLIFISVQSFTATLNYSPAKQVQIEYEGFIDTEDLDFSQALRKFSAGDFENMHYSKRAAVSGKSYWMRFNVKDVLKNHLLLFSGLFDSTCLFYEKVDGSRFQTCNGFKIKPAHRSFVDREAYFYLPDSTKDGYFYVNVHSNFGGYGLGFNQVPINEVLNNELVFYSFFSFFIGVSLIFGIYNFILFLRIFEKIYLFNSLYLFSFSAFAGLSTGVAGVFMYPFTFDFLWFFHIPFSLMTIFLILYSIYFLKDKTFPYFRQIAFFLIFLKVCLSTYGMLSGNGVYTTQKVDYFLLCVPFVAGLYSYLAGNKFVFPFLLAFTAIYIGYYSHSYMYRDGFIFIMGLLEIILFSYATSGRFRSILLENQKQNLETIALKDKLLEQSIENEKIKDINNKQLELLVKERTKDLEDANSRLLEQAEEIKKMNALLEQDNHELTHAIELMATARIMETNVSFDDFHKMFPDETTCFSFLSELKWANGFKCKKCKNEKYYKGNVPFSRRCSVCNYQESAVAFTIFENVRFPIDKAFYFVYFFYNNTNVNLGQLGQTLDLRLATCSNYKKKIQSKLSTFKVKKKQKSDWTSFILNE